MAKVCDNTSVALIVRKNDQVLFIERKKYNPGFALPAGHQDGDSAKDAAIKELSEEVGLTATEIQEVLVKDLQNPCSREGGANHRWTVFEVKNWHGDIVPSEDEAKQAVWLDAAQIKELALRLEKFIEKNGLSFDDLPELVEATNKSREWWGDPGLEPPMYLLFKELGII